MMRCNQVIILAGGLATRLQPASNSTPKSLIDIKGKPFLFHQLDLLRDQEFKKVTLLVGHLGELIVSAVRESTYFRHFDFDFIFDGPTLLGTAGSIRAAMSVLEDRFMTLYGDSYLECDYQKVFRKFTSEGRMGLMTVYKNDQQWDASNVVFDGEEIRVYSKERQRPEMNFIDYGLSFFRKTAFEKYVPEGKNYDLATLFEELLAKKELSSFEIDRRFYEIGSFGGIQMLTAYLEKQGRGN